MFYNIYLLCHSYIDYKAMYDESISNPNEFWGHSAKRFLTWIKMFDEVDGCNMDEGIIKWFTGGQLNVSGTFIQVLYMYLVWVSVCFQII